MRVSSFVIGSLAAATCASASGLRDVVIGINYIKSNSTALLTTLEKITGSNPIEDLGILPKSDALNNAVKAGTTVVSELSVPPTAIQTQGSINALKLVQDTTLQICQRLVEMKPNFDKLLIVTPIVKNSVVSLNSSVSDFGAALLKVASPKKQKSSKALLAQFQADLKICTDAYVAKGGFFGLFGREEES